MRKDAMPVAHCPDCDALVDPTSTRCWLCGTDIKPHDVSIGSEVLRLRSLPPPAPRQLRLTFSLIGALTLVTLLAICVAVMRYHLGLGIFLAIVLVPALVRTWLITSEPDMRRAGLAERFATLVGSLAISFFTMILVFAAAWCALFVSCGLVELGLVGPWPSYRGRLGFEGVIVTCLVISGIAGILTFFLLLPLWRRRR